MPARPRNTTFRRTAGAASVPCAGWMLSIRRSSGPGSSISSACINGARPAIPSTARISISSNGRRWQRLPGGLPFRISRRRRGYWAGLFDGLAGASIQRMARSMREITQNTPATAKQNNPASAQAPRRKESMSQNAASTTRPPINAAATVAIAFILRRRGDECNGR